MRIGFCQTRGTLPLVGLGCRVVVQATCVIGLSLWTQRNLEKHLLMDINAPSDLDEGFGKAVVLFVEADMADAAGREGRMALAELLNSADGWGFVFHDWLFVVMGVRSHPRSAGIPRRCSSA